MERSDGEGAKVSGGGGGEGRGEAEPMEIGDDATSSSADLVGLLRRFLAVQQRRAEAYTKLRRGFNEYMANGAELVYQQLCGEITQEFNDCSKQVLEMESLLSMPEICRTDLANLLKGVQVQEKQKLHLTIKIQVLKKAGRPSDRPTTHSSCRAHLHEITEDGGTEDAEADTEYDVQLKDAICGVQQAVTVINECLEEVRYEIEALEE
ncbi:hypothetical protein LUZ60_009243 [Juncus effusus]|nr:hypothetical protein LUZ60_009243 [Juncus effusus]